MLAPKNPMQIAIVGLGYVGLPLALQFARSGVKVLGLDVDHAEAIVNPVNCVGVMGRGLALQFKKAFPENFRAYAEACQKKLVQPGTMFVFEQSVGGQPRYIVNFPTKLHWRDNSRMEDIESGLLTLRAEVESRVKARALKFNSLGS